MGFLLHLKDFFTNHTATRLSSGLLEQDVRMCFLMCTADGIPRNILSKFQQL